MKQLAAVCLAIAFLVTAGCGNDEEGPGQFEYPLHLGNTWYYTRTWVTYNPDSSINSNDESLCVVAITDTFRLSGALTYRLEIREGEGSTATVWGAEFYQQSSYGLLRVGGCGFPPIVYPKRSAQGAIIRLPLFPSPGIGASVESGSDCDGMPPHFSNPGLLTIPYPERIGHSWPYAEDSGAPLAISRTIQGSGQTEVPAGSFDVYLIGWYYTPSLGLSVTDEVSSSGLIRRTINLDSLAMTDYQHPGGTVYGSWLEVLVLDSLRLYWEPRRKPLDDWLGHP